MFNMESIRSRNHAHSYLPIFPEILNKFYTLQTPPSSLLCCYFCCCVELFRSPLSAHSKATSRQIALLVYARNTYVITEAAAAATAAEATEAAEAATAAETALISGWLDESADSEDLHFRLHK